MQKALELIKEHDKIVRYRGGFWAQPNAPMKLLNSLEDTVIPKDSFGTQTVEALYKRGLIEASYWRTTENGLFITEYIPTKLAYDEQINKKGKKKKDGGQDPSVTPASDSIS